jgi:predicted DNA-binding transcriptional regulator YafY
MLQCLIKAIRERLVCSVSYTSALRGEAKQFAYAPGRLTAFHEALYVDGWVVSGAGKVQVRYDSPTTLAVHRLQTVRITRRSGAHLPEISEADSGAFGLMSVDCFTAKILFSAEASTYVAEREWSEGQKIVMHKDGTMTLTMNVRSREEFLSWILSFGDAAQVMAPGRLRVETAKRVAAVSALYAGKNI